VPSTATGIQCCPLAPKFDHLFALNFDQGPIAACH